MACGSELLCEVVTGEAAPAGAAAADGPGAAEGAWGLRLEHQDSDFVERRAGDAAESIFSPAGASGSKSGMTLEKASEFARQTQSSFIDYDSEEPVVYASPVRRFFAAVLYSGKADWCVGAVILFNFWLIILDIDSRADFPGHPPPTGPPAWVTLNIGFCFIFYVVELAIRLGVEQSAWVRKHWNLLDAVVVVVGILQYIVEWAGDHEPAFGVVRLVRVLRMLELLKVLRLFAIFTELRRLLTMMGGCARTLFWSFLLLLLVMSIWASIAVEFINPLVQEVADHGGWPGCERCRRSFSSVFMANITFFQTIVAGDSWGYMAIPVIEAYPWTASIFTSALMTLVFGVLNLIVAVIVDTCAENRAKDVVSKARDMDYEEIEEKKVLSRIFQKIDEDSSGAVSLAELQVGARKVAEFRHWLRVLDIDAHDLVQLFQIVDQDGSGEIDPNEFIEAMYRMKNTESKTATKFVKHMVTRMDHEQRHVKSELSVMKSNLEVQFTENELVLERVVVDSEAAMRQRLLDQEQKVLRSIEVAMAKATEVALEAALQAAAVTAQNVMARVTGSGRMLVEGVHSRMQMEGRHSWELARDSQRLSPSSRGSAPSYPHSMTDESTAHVPNVGASGGHVEVGASRHSGCDGPGGAINLSASLSDKLDRPCPESKGPRGVPKRAPQPLMPRF